MALPRPAWSRKWNGAGLWALALLCMVAWSCGGSNPGTSSASEGADSASTEPVASDTSLRDTAVSVGGQESPPPAPGTALVRASVISCDTTTAPARCQLQIAEVLAYGASTPPLSTGERTVGFDSTLFSGRIVRDLREVGERTYTLHHRGEQPVFAEESSERERLKWLVRSINDR